VHEVIQTKLKRKQGVCWFVVLRQFCVG
ncbi:hypothetical protein D030_0104B, partial [Vibrio parahaemolyticus AQ3810]